MPANPGAQRTGEAALPTFGGTPRFPQQLLLAESTERPRSATFLAASANSVVRQMRLTASEANGKWRKHKCSV